MSLCENYDVEDPLRLDAADTGSNAPYVFDSNQNSVCRRALPDDDRRTRRRRRIRRPGHRVRRLLSHFAFGTNDVEFATGGSTSAPGSAYDNDVAANTATVISKLPGGANIPQDPQGCTNEKGHQRQCKDEFVRIQGRVDRWLQHPDVDLGQTHEWRIPDQKRRNRESHDTLIHRDLHLYMHTPAPTTTSPKATGPTSSAWTATAPRVYFTSDEKLTPDDTDESIDLYMWEEASGELTLPLEGARGRRQRERMHRELGRKMRRPDDRRDDRPAINAEEEEIYTPDNWTSQTGEIYFYSPEQLDGSKGSANQRNLYVYRNGAPQFVTTLRPPAPRVRMQVAPDGAHMAFVTATQVTSYENNGTRQMYLYEPGKPPKGTE